MFCGQNLRHVLHERRQGRGPTRSTTWCVCVDLKYFMRSWLMKKKDNKHVGWPVWWKKNPGAKTRRTSLRGHVADSQRRARNCGGGPGKLISRIYMCARMWENLVLTSASLGVMLHGDRDRWRDTVACRVKCGTTVCASFTSPEGGKRNWHWQCVCKAKNITLTRRGVPPEQAVFGKYGAPAGARYLFGAFQRYF